MAETTGGYARPQNLELIAYNSNASDVGTCLQGSGGPILVTHHVDQVSDRMTDVVLEAELVRVSAGASTWNI